MSSKRGRKRNDNLPPNRARDVQRAFRARRACHLQALEQRVAELEEENESLRAALNLPPANRPPLGKGPTGKDKEKPIAGGSSRPDGPELNGRDDSPSTPPTSASSPHSTSFAINSLPSSATGVNNVPWDPSGVLHDDHVDADGAHAPTQYRFSQHPQSTSRSSISSDMFLPQGVQNYTHSSDRPMGFGRDESQYTYAQPHSSASHSPANHMRNLSSSTSGSLSGDSMQQPQQNVPYGVRRSINVTETQHLPPIVDNLPHLPYPQQTSSAMRLPPGSRLPYSSPGYG